MKMSVKLGAVLVAIAVLRATTEELGENSVGVTPLKSDFGRSLTNNQMQPLGVTPFMEDRKNTSLSSPAFPCHSCQIQETNTDGNDSWNDVGIFASLEERGKTLVSFNSTGRDGIEELGKGNIRTEEEGQDEDCSNINRRDQSPFIKELGRHFADLLKQLEVPAVALITQCDIGQQYPGIISPVGSAGISMCLFVSMASLVDSVMKTPKESLCFLSRRWTVALLGSPEWAAMLITRSKKEGLYDSRVHWIVLATGKSSIVTTLPLYDIIHSVTWLRYSDQLNEMVSNAVGRCYYEEDGSTSCIGYVGAMLMIITKTLNLAVSNSMVKSCGMADSNGTRVTVIANDEADIALGTCTITTDRVQVVDFTEFFYVSGSTIASAEPSVLQSPFLIFSVFSWDTWLAILCYIVIVTLALYTSGKIISLVNEDYYKSLPAAFAVVAKALLYQGHQNQPRSASGRALVAVSWGIIITLVGVYAGNLTAWLSLPRYARPVNSLADLEKRRDITPVVLGYDPNHLMFENQTEGLLGAVAKRLVVLYDGIKDDVEFIRDIVRGKTAYFNSGRSHLSRATNLNEHEGVKGFAPCRIYIASEDIRQDYLGLIISKNSWLSEQFNKQIQWLRSCGIINYLYAKYNPPGCRLTTNKDRRRMSKTKSLGVLELQGVFWVWVVGMTLAALVLLVEKFMHLASPGPDIPTFTFA